MPIEIPQRRPRLTNPGHLVLALAAVMAVLFVAVPAANAATFCVGSPAGCSGIDKPGDGAGLQAAFDEASVNADDDEVRIGPGTYTAHDANGFEVTSPANAIQILGSGSELTILRGQGADGVALKVTGDGHNTSSVRDLALGLSDDGGTPVGLIMSATRASALLVTAPAGVTSGAGMRLAGGARVESTRVIVPGLDGIETIGAAEVSRSLIEADVGIQAKSGPLAIAWSRIEASHIGIDADTATDVSNTLIRVSGGAADGAGITCTASVNANQLTVVGTGSPAYGVRAFKLGGATAYASVSRSTVTGFEHDLSTGADALSHSTIVANRSNFWGVQQLSGGELISGIGNLAVAPRFVDPAAGDFHLRHDSPLIDTGAGIASPEDLDFDGLTRFVDGDGVGGPGLDIGAFEYQRAAPSAAIAAPDSAIAGQALELSGAGSADPDPGEALTYAWSFGDGSAASGATASYAYAAPGTYAVTLVVTDPAGLQTTATKQVVVRAPGAAGGGDTADRLAPVISRLRALPRRRLIRFRLSEGARVTIRLTRAGRPRLVRTLRLSGRSGANKVRLRRRLLRTLGPGRHRIKVSARDAAGNLAKPRVARLRLRS
jgi:hypothetical protein